MQLAIKTLSAGTYDGELKGYDNLEDMVKKLASSSNGWLKLDTREGLVLLNKSNIVSITRKR